MGTRCIFTVEWRGVDMASRSNVGFWFMAFVRQYVRREVGSVICGTSNFVVLEEHMSRLICAI
jgi:hypothetical protein